VVQAFKTVLAKSIQKMLAHIGNIDKNSVVDANSKQLVGDDDDHEDETSDEGLENEVDVNESELIIR
jgi:hypothetical protein